MKRGFKSDEQRKAVMAKLRASQGKAPRSYGEEGWVRAGDFITLKGAETGDRRIAYTFRSKDGSIEANVFWEPRNVEMRGLVGETGTLHVAYPFAGGRGKPPRPEVFLSSLVQKLNRGEFDGADWSIR